MVKLVMMAVPWWCHGKAGANCLGLTRKERWKTVLDRQATNAYGVQDCLNPEAHRTRRGGKRQICLLGPRARQICLEKDKNETICPPRRQFFKAPPPKWTNLSLWRNPDLSSLIVSPICPDKICRPTSGPHRGLANRWPTTSRAPRWLRKHEVSAA